MSIVVAPSALHIDENGTLPNNPALPVLIYRKVLAPHAADKDRTFQQHFDASGWRGIWKNGLYDYHHFHSTSHEALGVARGAAAIQLGGEGGKVLRLEAGDLIVLPAGVAHRRVSSSENAVIVGAYPDGQQDYDLCRGDGDRSAAVAAAIARVPLPTSDPFYGDDGPLLRQWR
jgi:uncharacterized protein YjlB